MAKLSPRKKTAAKARFESGTPFSTIARDIGCHEVTIRQWAKKEGWVRGETLSVQPLVPKESSPPERKGIPQAIHTKPLEEIGKEVRSKLARNIETTLERVASLSPGDMKEEVQLETVLGSITKRAATVFGWSESQSNPLVSVNLLGALPDREVTVSATPPEATE